MEKQDAVNNLPIRVSVPINSPFDMFLDDQWTWISDGSEPYEYTELDNIYMYISGELDKSDLPEYLHNLSDDELRKEYSNRFPILFGKVLESLGKKIITEEIVMHIKYK